jgi:hypothetical protein
MTSGVRTRSAEARRRGLLAAALLLTVLPAAAIELGGVMALLAQRKSGEARFTEERWVSNLDRSLQSSGTLSFSAPDQFARHTERPRPESMEVRGNLLVLRRGDRTRQMTLDTVPELAALVDGLRGTLNGDAEALRRHFRTEVSGNSSLWTLALTPLDSRLRAQVNQLEISGSGADIRSIELRLNGGDRSLMQVEPFATVRR